MIILPERQLAIITPPKNASSTLHHVLCQPSFGGIYVMGPMPIGEPVDIEVHTTIVPRRWRQYRIVIVVRNPFARALSLWFHARAYHDCQDTFGDFVARQLCSCPHWWHWPNYRYLPRGCRDLIRVESLPDDLAAIGLNVPDLPMQHQLTTGTVAEHYDRQALSLVGNWAARDFELFGYDAERLPNRTPANGTANKESLQKLTTH